MKLTINDSDQLLDESGATIGPVFDSVANRKDLSISDIQRAYNERVAALKKAVTDEAAKTSTALAELATLKTIVSKAAKEQDPAKRAKHLADAEKPERERLRAEKRAQIAKLQAEEAALG